MHNFDKIIILVEFLSKILHINLIEQYIYLTFMHVSVHLALSVMTSLTILCRHVIL